MKGDFEMARIENFYVIFAGLVIVAVGYLFEMIEKHFAEDSWFWHFFDAFSIAAIFYLTMKILKWAVWVLG